MATDEPPADQPRRTDGARQEPERPAEVLLEADRGPAPPRSPAYADARTGADREQAPPSEAYADARARADRGPGARSDARSAAGRRGRGRPGAAHEATAGGRAAISDGAEEGGSPIGRRIVLGMLGLGALGIAVGERVQRRIETATRSFTANDPTGLSSFVPTAGRFRIYSVTPTMPDRAPQDWRLAVDGLVDTPLDLSFDDLLARPQREVTLDFQCVTGWRVQDVYWKGVRVGDLLDEAGVRGDATHLRIWSFDGAYTESLTLDQARRDDVLVAHEMIDGPVTREHGGPVRLFVGPMYGYKSLKWLERIEVVDELHPGYWEQRGYDIDAWVGRSNGRDDDPIA